MVSTAPGLEVQWVLQPLRTQDNQPIPIPRGEAVTIGRKRDSNIICRRDRAVSAHHCHITESCDDIVSLEVEDRSTNGTCVNGQPVGKGGKARLAHGDILSLSRPLQGNWGEVDDDYTQFRVELRRAKADTARRTQPVT